MHESAGQADFKMNCSIVLWGLMFEFWFACWLSGQLNHASVLKDYKKMIGVGTSAESYISLIDYF